MKHRISAIEAVIAIGTLLMILGLAPSRAAPAIAPAWFIQFTQPASALNGNVARNVWYGPEATLASCLGNFNVIIASSGIGGTAWGYQPTAICYQVAGY